MIIGIHRLKALLHIANLITHLLNLTNHLIALVSLDFHMRTQSRLGLDNHEIAWR